MNEEFCTGWGNRKPFDKYAITNNVIIKNGRNFYFNRF